MVEEVFLVPERDEFSAFKYIMSLPNLGPEKTSTHIKSRTDVVAFLFCFVFKIQLLD